MYCLYLYIVVCITSIPWIADVQDEVDHLADRDRSIMIGVR